MTVPSDRVFEPEAAAAVLPPTLDPQSAAAVLRLAAWIAARSRVGAPVVIGLNGAQGSGKSTLAARLAALLEAGAGRRTAVLGLDDFYLVRIERQALAQRVHPLLATRGVPGTHDVALLQRSIAGLRRLAADEELRLPRFIKALDDRAPESAAASIRGPVDLILLEGWCVGTPPQDDAALATPINALEAVHDPQGHWRTWVNQQLRQDYAALFASLDHLILLQAPGFECVHRWRLEQEVGNAAAVAQPSQAMDAAALTHFIAHYERLTRHALQVLPAQADVVLRLDAQRRILDARLDRS